MLLSHVTILGVISEIQMMISSWGGQLHVKNSGSIRFAPPRSSVYRKLKTDRDGVYTEAFPHWSDSPFSDLYAICWNTKEIAMSIPKSDLELCGLFHEVGHVFACLTDPMTSECEEIDFFAWEWQLARQFRLGRAWQVANKSYGIYRVFPEFDSYDFGDLGESDQLIFLEKLLEKSKASNPALFAEDQPSPIR